MVFNPLTAWSSRFSLQDTARQVQHVADVELLEDFGHLNLGMAVCACGLLYYCTHYFTRVPLDSQGTTSEGIAWYAMGSSSESRLLPWRNCWPRVGSNKPTDALDRYGPIVCGIAVLVKTTKSPTKLRSTGLRNPWTRGVRMWTAHRILWDSMICLPEFGW